MSCGVRRFVNEGALGAVRISLLDDPRKQYAKQTSLKRGTKNKIEVMFRFECTLLAQRLEPQNSAAAGQHVTQLLRNRIFLI